MMKTHPELVYPEFVDEQLENEVRVVRWCHDAEADRPRNATTDGPESA
jgi:hypothetical protein